MLLFISDEWLETKLIATHLHQLLRHFQISKIYSPRVRFFLVWSGFGILVLECWEGLRTILGNKKIIEKTEKVENETDKEDQDWGLRRGQDISTCSIVAQQWPMLHQYSRTKRHFSPRWCYKWDGSPGGVRYRALLRCWEKRQGER